MIERTTNVPRPPVVHKWTIKHISGRVIATIKAETRGRYALVRVPEGEVSGPYLDELTLALQECRAQGEIPSD